MTATDKLRRLFVKPDTPFGAYPFDQIEETDYETLLEKAVAEQRDAIKTIENHPDAPSFKNTVLALEQSGESIEALSGAFYNLLSADGSELLEKTAQSFSAKLSQLSSDILLSERLFERIRAIYDHREAEELSPIDNRLLLHQYRQFTRNGALLEPDKKEELRAVNEALGIASLQFGAQMLKDTKLFRYYIAPSKAETIRNLPENILKTAQNRAQEERGVGGFLLTLDAPEYMAVMSFAEDAELRKTFYLAKMKIGYQNNDCNNASLVRKIVNLRLRKAQLLGYESYADFALNRKMLDNSGKVLRLLEELQKASYPKARRELKAAEEIKGAPLEPWDVNFYLERLCEKQYRFSLEELRPYFPLGATIRGVLGLAERLYGLKFTREESIPVYNKEVSVYRVDDPAGKGYMGLLYLDFFPRRRKKSGAWMNNLREADADHRPHILLVMNFGRPVEGKEALLLPSEVHTFLHEFGHALQGLLTEVPYSSLSGTNVVRDFVELPSQINENWLTEREFLNSFARHHESGDPIPEDLLTRFVESARLRTGYDTQRQLAFGFLDMAWHTIIEPLDENADLETLEAEAFDRAPGFGHLPEGCMMSTSFGHLFNGGYACGYYGYKWSEVLSTDAFALFKEKGIFDRQTAGSFRKNILAAGNSEDPEVLYRRFRGKDPDLKALKKRDGFE